MHHQAIPVLWVYHCSDLPDTTAISILCSRSSRHVNLQPSVLSTRFRWLGKGIISLPRRCSTPGFALPKKVYGDSERLKSTTLPCTLSPSRHMKATNSGTDFSGLGMTPNESCLTTVSWMANRSWPLLIHLNSLEATRRRRSTALPVQIPRLKSRLGGS